MMASLIHTTSLFIFLNSEEEMEGDLSKGLTGGPKVPYRVESSILLGGLV